MKDSSSRPLLKKRAYLLEACLVFMLAWHAQADSFSLSNSERNQIQVFLQGFLGKSANGLIKRTKVVARSDLSPGLWGHTSQDQNTIEIDAELLGDRQHLLATLVHELIHQYSYAQKRNDDDFFEEGTALLGEYLFLGQLYGKEAAIRSFLPIVESALKNTHENLFTLNRTAADYGRSFLFFLFLHETFNGNHFNQYYSRETKTSWEGVINSLEKSSSKALIPKTWINAHSLQQSFLSSLESRRNVLALTQNDSFTLMLSLITR